MKKTTLRTFAIASALTLSITSQGTAAIVLGDTLVLDFGLTSQVTTGNWNNYSQAASGGFGPGSGTLVADMVRFSDGATTGVSLSYAGGNANSPGIGGAAVATVGSAASFTVSGQIPDNAQIDQAFVSVAGTTITLGNLNPLLTYNLEIMSKIDAARNANNIVVNGTTIPVDPDSSPFVTAYTGIAPNVSNEIVISFPNAAGSADLQHINAFELTAVPEPSAGLLSLAGLGLALARRRRS